MSIKCMNYVWEHSETEGADRLMLLALADSCSDDGEWSPGVTSLAKKCNVKERAAQYTLRRLVDAGEIAVELNAGFNTKTGRTNKYIMVRYLNFKGVQPTAPLNSQGVQPTAPQGVQPTAPDPSVLTTSKNKRVLATQGKPKAKANTTPVQEKEAGVTGDAIPSPNSAAPLPTEQQRKFQLLCNIVGWDYKTLTKEQQGQVAQTLGILTKAGYTEEDLSQFFDKVWSKDWRWQNHRSYPTLSQVRAEIGKLRAAPDTVPVVVAPVVTAAETPKLAPYLRMQQRKGYYTQ